MSSLSYSRVKASGLHPKCPKGMVNVKIDEGKLIIEPWFFKKLLYEPYEIEIHKIQEINHQQGDGFRGNMSNAMILGYKGGLLERSAVVTLLVPYEKSKVSINIFFKGMLSNRKSEKFATKLVELQHLTKKKK